MTNPEIAENISVKLAPLYELLGSVFVEKYNLIPLPVSCDGKTHHTRQHKNLTPEEEKKEYGQKLRQADLLGRVQEEMSSFNSSFKRLTIKELICPRMWGENIIKFQPAFEVAVENFLRPSDELCALVDKTYSDNWGKSPREAIHFPDKAAVEAEFERDAFGFYTLGTKSKGHTRWRIVGGDEEQWLRFISSVGYFNFHFLRNFFAAGPAHACIIVPSEELSSNLSIMHQGRCILRPDNVIRVMNGEPLSFHYEKRGILAERKEPGEEEVEVESLYFTVNTDAADAAKSDGGVSFTLTHHSFEEPKRYGEKDKEPVNFLGPQQAQATFPLVRMLAYFEGLE